MGYTEYLILGALCLLGFSIYALIKLKMKYKAGRLLDPTRILFMGIILTSLILFLPIYNSTFSENDKCGPFHIFFLSVHNMIRLFVVDGDFDIITKNVPQDPAWVYVAYTGLMSILFVLAPILTFGFVMSFFKNASAYKNYFYHYNSNVYIFSKLTEKSLALAEDLHKKPEGRFFVFTEVLENEEGKNYDLVEKARALGAVCFKNDIVGINFSFHNKNREINFFVIGEDETENVNQALKLINKIGGRKNTNLYVFSAQMETEILLAQAYNDYGGTQNIKVRRINNVQSLVLRNLYENGYEKIFQPAYDDGTGVKKINAVVVGMGQHGTEMTKALSWFCQMDGYLAEIHALDLDDRAEEKFTSQCPELMKFSGKLDIEGDAKYTIRIHSGMDVDTISFDNLIASLPETTYVFVALGNDEKNISTAVKLRMIFERLGIKPVIQAVIYNSDKKEALKDAENYNGGRYNIDFVGDIKTSYSENVVLGSDVEKQALQRHMQWGEERKFWQYNYNYKSSVASAIHKKMKIECGIPGIEKTPKDRTKEELWAIRTLEHCRWNAYMRSEGYVYSGSIEKSTRNDLAKKHHCLVPFKDLPLKEQEKDDD